MALHRLRPSPATNPLQLLQQHLEREFAKAEERRDELVALRHTLDRLAEQVRSGSPTGGLEPVPPELAPGVVTALFRDTTGPVRTWVLNPQAGIAFDERIARAKQARFAAGDEQLVLYPAEAIESPAALQWLRAWAAVGEQQRVVPATGTEFALFGAETVMGLARWGDRESGWVMSGDPFVVDAYRRMFDLTWAAAPPVPGTVPDDEADARLLDLLGIGLKDEAIARLLGTSLRTVRRRVARLMVVHGVQTRFQLGAAVTVEGRDPRRGALSGPVEERPTPRPGRSRADRAR